MQKLWLFFIGALLFFLPLFIGAEAVVDFKLKKIYFSLKLFGLSLFGGYINNDGLKFYVHIKDDKALLFDLGDFMKKRKKLFKPKGILILGFKSASFFSLDVPVVLPETLLIASNIICPIIKSEKPFIKLNNDVVFCKEQCLYSVIRFCFVINIATISAMFINSLIKKAVKYVKGKM